MPIYALDGEAPSLPPPGRYWVAPDATVVGRVTLGEDASIWFAAVLRGDNEPMRVGDRSNIQDGAVLHSDDGFPLTVGNDCTIGHGARNATTTLLMLPNIFLKLSFTIRLFNHFTNAILQIK